MKKHILEAQKRTHIGRAVKLLRREGVTPASVFGKGVPSLSVQVNLKELTKLEKEVGGTGLVYLKIGDEERPVLIKNLQRHPVSGLPLHADFHQVNLKEKITANIPVETTGDPIAVTEGKGILIQTLSEVEAEALPTDLPEKITIDVSTLSDIDQAVFVKDLKIPSSVKLLSDPEEMIAKIAPLAKEEVVTPPSSEEVPADQAPGETAPSAEQTTKETASAPTPPTEE